MTRISRSAPREAEQRPNIVPVRRPQRFNVPRADRAGIP
jgi:hypothetical protein